MKEMQSFDPELTLMESGQVFHWQKNDSGSFVAVVDGRIMTDSDDDAKAKYYFDALRDYSTIRQETVSIPQAKEAMRLLPGLRVLNQPVWETLIAFIFSANNNIKRIRSLTNALNETYSDPYTYRGKRYYGFPSPKTLAKLDPCELKKCVTCGYRAEYIVETAKMVCDGFALEGLKDMPVEQGRKELEKLKGVGPKVAECVLLFGCAHSDAFPVDVWVTRLMEKWFGVTGTPQYISGEGRRILGPHCGIIQQFMFHAARTGLIAL